MGIHSDSIYKDTQREVEAEKVDTERVVGKDAEGNIFAKVEDTAEGGLISLFDETGIKRGEISINVDDRMEFNSPQSNKIEFSVGSTMLYIGDGYANWYGDLLMEDNPIKRLSHIKENAVDSAPASPTDHAIYLASPTWDPDSDGNGEYVCYDGTAWQEVCDLPNYT